MKVLLVGTFLPGYLEFSFEKYLKECKCQVFRFDMMQIIRNSLFYFFDKNNISRKIFKTYWEYLINERLISSFKQTIPDLILVLKGYYIWPTTIKKLKDSRNSLIFCFNSDNPLNLTHPGASNKNILESVSYYDCYFIWSRLLIEPLLKRGVKKVEYLPFGFDPDLHHPVNLTAIEKKLYGNEIVFVGNWDEEREKWLKELEDFDLGLWGSNYWLRRCRNKQLRKRWHGKEVIAEEMSRVLNASKISLNILREQNKGSHNMRTFEAPACGAFVLTERSSETKEFFREDKEAVYFSTPEEIRDKIQYYLKHDKERKRIAQAGYERCIKSNYSYLDRVKDILKVYERE